MEKVTKETINNLKLKELLQLQKEVLLFKKSNLNTTAVFWTNNGNFFTSDYVNQGRLLTENEKKELLFIDLIEERIENLQINNI